MRCSVSEYDASSENSDVKCCLVSGQVKNVGHVVDEYVEGVEEDEEEGE